MATTSLAAPREGMAAGFERLAWLLHVKAWLPDLNALRHINSGSFQANVERFLDFG